MALTKKELVRLVSEDTNLTQKQVNDVFSSIVSKISQGLVEQNKVQIPNLGTFEKVHRRSRTARNPQTGMPIVVEAKNVAVFRPAGKLKEIIN